MRINERKITKARALIKLPLCFKNRKRASMLKLRYVTGSSENCNLYKIKYENVRLQWNVFKVDTKITGISIPGAVKFDIVCKSFIFSNTENGSSKVRNARTTLCDAFNRIY